MTSRFSAEMSPARGLGLAGRALDGFDAPHDVPEGRPREKGCRDEARGVEHGDGGDWRPATGPSRGLSVVVACSVRICRSHMCTERVTRTEQAVSLVGPTNAGRDRDGVSARTSDLGQIGAAAGSRARRPDQHHDRRSPTLGDPPGTRYGAGGGRDGLSSVPGLPLAATQSTDAALSHTPSLGPSNPPRSRILHRVTNARR